MIYRAKIWQFIKWAGRVDRNMKTDDNRLKMWNDLKNGIHETTEYLEIFLRNLLLNENHPLHNRTLKKTLVIDIRPSRASEFLKELTEYGIIEPVAGHGKGKYRFRAQ